MSLTPPSSFSPVLRGSASNTGLTTTQIDGNFSGIATNANWSVSSIASLISSTGAALIGIIQTGAGAVARNVAAKLGETVSITDFGAVPNTSGAAAAFLAAMNSLGSTGGKIIIPPGTWLWESQITSTKDYVHVEIQGGAVVQQVGNLFNMLVIGHNYWTISGTGVFDGGGLSDLHGANIACGILYPGGSGQWGGNYCKFENFETRNSGGQGMGLWGLSETVWLTGCSVHKVYAHDNYSIGILMSEARYCRITSNHVYNNGLEGITVDNTSGYNTIDGNIGLHNCTRGGTGNIGAGALANHNVFTNNILQGAQNGAHGLSLQGHNDVIKGNVFTANTGYGLYLDSSCIASIIDSNQYDSNTLGPRYYAAGSLNNVTGAELINDGVPSDSGDNFNYAQPIDNHLQLATLKRTRLKIRRIKSNLGSYTNTNNVTISSQLVVAGIGDSYTQIGAIWSSPLTQQLWSELGNAGMGWIGFGYGGTGTPPWTTGNQPTNQDIGAAYNLTGGFSIFQLIGSWVGNYLTSADNTPSLSQVTSSTATDYIRLNFPAGQTSCMLYYGGNGTGVIAVSWNDGTSYGSNISLTTVGAGHIALSGIPNTANTLRIKVVSGTVTLAGVDIQASTAGFRFHKIAAGGATSVHWSTVTAATWGAQLAALSPDLVTIMLGNNDKGTLTPAQFATNLTLIINNVRAAIPKVDILLISPMEDNRANTGYLMQALALAMRQVAIRTGVAYFDMQPYFGRPDNAGYDYAFTDLYTPYIQSDLMHPDIATGGQIMMDAVYRALMTM